ncbi:MAG: addiction module antidote protein, HigA family [Mesorhizobium sp.]|uniref:HigA family addiction module antitoxin n=1 Tax=Mesorhizobium sp. TaxID=1871066 RepID=UPI001228B6CF|nr:MAG: addiction module antidote protein, HigA family [Mesorhizobium sp.]TIW10864.1 MAG: addiction module antidote protein, HigA family [Mesorhizobium sp.]
MIAAKAQLSRTPPHPGGFVRLKIIEPLCLSVKDAASVLGVHRVALSRLLNEQAALSAEMAIRLEKAFGADMAGLMRMQSEYDIGQARLKFSSVEVSKSVKDKDLELVSRESRGHSRSIVMKHGRDRKMQSNNRS